MHITAFNGSPWTHQSHSEIVTQQFLDGASAAGAKTETVYLAQKNIEMCSNCSHCFYQTPGQCKISDDMAALIKRFLASDVAILATPVYFDNVSALMKNFIDRLMPVLQPYYEKDSAGQYLRRARYKKYPRLFAIATCALPEFSNFDCLTLFFSRLARTLHTTLAGEIYCPAAGVLSLSDEALQFRPPVDSYKNLLAAAGKEFVSAGSISDSLLQKLHQPIIDPDEYVDYANQTWETITPEKPVKILR